MSKSSTENEAQTGGKLYDQGAYGCVFIPSLICKDEVGIKTPNSDNRDITIDKLISVKEADEEYRIGSIIRRLPLWKNYFIVAEKICVPAARKEQIEPDLNKCKILNTVGLEGYRLLRMRFGGVPLDIHKMNIREYRFEDFAIHLLEAGAMLSLFGIVHRDLHFGNVLVDNINVPRIIDFNLSLDIRKPIQEKNLVHSFSVNYVQESPDYCLINGLVNGIDGYDIIEQLLSGRNTLNRIVSVLGVSKDIMRKQLSDFYKNSNLVLQKDIVGWFRKYWATIDAWAIGIILTHLVGGLIMLDNFRKGEWQQNKLENRLIPILRNMCNFNPMQRLNCVEALALLDPENFIIKKFGRTWIRPAHRRPV